MTHLITPKSLLELIIPLIPFILKDMNKLSNTTNHNFPRSGNFDTSKLIRSIQNRPIVFLCSSEILFSGRRVDLMSNDLVYVFSTSDEFRMSYSCCGCFGSGEAFGFGGC